MTMDKALKTARSGTAARPLTNATGRNLRLGTASMLADSDPTMFINPARLDIQKYAGRPILGKVLFRYLLHVANDVALALDLASAASALPEIANWWWHAMVGVCQYRLGMFQDAKKALEQSFEEQPMVFTALLLGKVHIRLDQPIAAIDAYELALKHFPEDTSLLSAVARVLEGVGNLPASVAAYRKVLRGDATDSEAIASLAADHFYSGHPETALLLYRRLLQMGAGSAELLNNLALSCYYAQQYDMALGCFERAVQQADDDEALADVWYNISHVGVSLGDVRFATQCLKLAVTCNPTHAEAYANLGALEHRHGNTAQARAHYTTAIKHSDQLYEPHHNLGVLAEKDGDIEASFKAASAAAALFPEHLGTQKMLKRLRQLFNTT